MIIKKATEKHDDLYYVYLHEGSVIPVGRIRNDDKDDKLYCQLGNVTMTADELRELADEMDKIERK